MNSSLLILYYIVGLLLGVILTRAYFHITCKTVATLKIDRTDPGKDSYMFEVNVPLEELSTYKTIRVRIVENTPPSMKE